MFTYCLNLMILASPWLEIYRFSKWSFADFQQFKFNFHFATFGQVKISLKLVVGNYKRSHSSVNEKKILEVPPFIAKLLMVIKSDWFYSIQIWALKTIFHQWKLFSRRFKSPQTLWNRDTNVTNILASLACIFSRWNSF